MAVSTYFINRDPNRFGGQQEDYKAQVKNIVAQGTQKVQSAMSNCSDLKKVFFSLQTSLEKDRQRIAKEHKTSFAGRIAVRRNTEEAVKNGETAAFTHFEDTYKDYGDKMIGDLAKRLETMRLGNTATCQRKLETVEPEYLKMPSSFGIELFSLDEIEQELHWTQPPDWSKHQAADMIARDPSLSLLEKLRRMSKVAPKLHMQDKMWSYISTLCTFHQGAKITDFVLATKRQLINGKLVPVSQYLTWINRNMDDPIAAMKKESRILVLHQDLLLLDDSLNDIAALFEKAVNWTPAYGVKDLKDRVGLFRSAYAEAMPHHRGSGAIAEWFENIIYSVHGYDLAYAEDKSLDLESLTSFSLAGFMKVYDGVVTLTKRV